MRRVLIFSLTYHPYIGGAEVAIREITDRLGADYVFDMVTLRFDSTLPAVEKIGNVTVHRIGFSVPRPSVSDRSMPILLKLAKALFPFTALFRALSLRRKNSYDFVWAMMANQAGFAALFFKFLNPGIPYLLELQDGRPFADMARRRPILLPIWWLYRLVYLRADRIKVISHFLEKEVQGIGYAGTVAVVPNGVDVSAFSRAIPEDARSELKVRLGKKMGDVFLFTASRLVLSRGVEDTIRALAYLPTHVRLLIAGDGEDRKKLEDVAAKAGVAGRVQFLGHIRHDALPAYYQVSDIFVRPSIIEGFGNSFVEAFAAGLPVVATPVGGIPDFLSDPDADPDTEPTGIFCKVRNPESVAAAVEKYMKDPILTERIKKNARELAARRYDWNGIAADMKKRVFEALANRG
jgi:glycosyltransferase involved in cell wall biosynthesis